MKKFLSLGVALAIGVTVLGTGPAQAANNPIIVPTDFIPGPGNGNTEIGSDTRATGSYELVGSSLHIKTTGTTSTDKVAEYVRTVTTLADAANANPEPNLEYDTVSGTIPPGTQLGVDFDGNGATDGILVGEPVYNGDWWLNRAALQFAKDGAPVTGGGSGTDWHGTLDQWSTNFPEAVIRVFGFSLGSGVQGEGYLRAINLAGVRYTFAPPPPPDTTGPTITCTTPAPVFVAASSATVTATAEDAGSGPASTTISAPADTSSLGAKTGQLTATDNNNNSTTQACPYTVVAGPAASIVVVSGTPQSTPVSTQFAQALQVKVSDANGFPVEGATVTFTAPASGASGSFSAGTTVVTDSTGTAATNVTANAKTGPWTATAAVAGVAQKATFKLANTAAPAKKADVQVTLTGPAKLTKGQTATFTLTVKNVGPDAAVDVVPSLGLSTCGVKLVSASGKYTKAGGLIIWTKIPTLAKNGVATYTVTVKATSNGSFTAFGGAASLKTGDPVLANNIAGLKFKIG